MKMYLAPFAAGAALLGLAPLLHANELLVNGGFGDEPNYGSGYLNYGSYSVFIGNEIPGWTIAPDHAATIHNASTYPTIDGNYSLNTDGEGTFGNNVLIYQDFSSLSGSQYNLSFKWETWNLNSGAKLEVTVFDTTRNDVLFDGIYPDTAPSSENVNTTFTGTGDNLRLQIDENPQSFFNDNAFIVDDFSVTSSSVPDSTGLGAELAALLLVGGLARRFLVARA